MENTRAKLLLSDITLTKRAGAGENVETRRVLDGVSLRVNAGEIYGVIGPSGSGKTTLLRVMNALDTPDEGAVLLDGQDTREMDVVGVRRRIGMVFQVPALFRGTVGENVSFALRIAGVGRAEMEKRAHECLDLVGLPRSFLDRAATKLSLGEQQRAAIARALVAEPEVVLMDEPTSALDPGAASRILTLAQSLNRETGLTVVFVTHLMEQARGICQRALVLIRGRGVEEGDVEDVFGRPTCEITRRFVDGELDSGEDEGERGCGCAGRGEGVIRSK